jgi:hypothetical protein
MYSFRRLGTCFSNSGLHFNAFRKRLGRKHLISKAPRKCAVSLWVASVSLWVASLGRFGSKSAVSLCFALTIVTKRKEILSYRAYAWKIPGVRGLVPERGSLTHRIKGIQKRFLNPPLPTTNTVANPDTQPQLSMSAALFGWPPASKSHPAFRKFEQAREQLEQCQRYSCIRNPQHET